MPALKKGSRRWVAAWGFEWLSPDRALGRSAWSPSTKRNGSAGVFLLVALILILVARAPPAEAPLSCLAEAEANRARAEAMAGRFRPCWCCRIRWAQALAAPTGGLDLQGGCAVRLASERHGTGAEKAMVLPQPGMPKAQAGMQHHPRIVGARQPSGIDRTLRNGDGRARAYAPAN